MDMRPGFQRQIEPRCGREYLDAPNRHRVAAVSTWMRQCEPRCGRAPKHRNELWVSAMSRRHLVGVPATSSHRAVPYFGESIAANCAGPKGSSSPQHRHAPWVQTLDHVPLAHSQIRYRLIGGVQDPVDEGRDDELLDVALSLLLAFVKGSAVVIMKTPLLPSSESESSPTA